MKTHTITQDTLGPILAGTKKLNEAVSTTMGPRGNNVIFRKLGKKVGVTHDGVTVARAFKLDDPVEDTAAELLREAASKMDMTTGDGTTTVTVLAYAILEEAAKRIREGENPQRLRAELDLEVGAVVEEIKKHIIETTEKEAIQVASVSAGDAEIGYDVGKALFEAGKDVAVDIGYSDAIETYVESVKGFKIPSGPASPYLLQTAKQVYGEVTVVVADAKLTEKEDVLPMLRYLAELPPDKKHLLLVCTDISSDALSLLVTNHVNQFAGIAVNRVPSHISAPTPYLQDFAAVVGARVLTKATLDQVDSQSVGSAEKVTISPIDTVVLGGGGDTQEYAEELLKSLESKNAGVRALTNDRLKSINQKIISIQVGGQSSSDAEERFYRFEDAVGAVKAALRGGVVPGGGTLLASIKTDSDILNKALTRPMDKVLANAGIEQVGDTKAGIGYDVLHPEDGEVDLVERGILDPAESEIECVRTAVTIAGLLMTSGAMIVDENETEK